MKKQTACKNCGKNYFYETQTKKGLYCNNQCQQDYIWKFRKERVEKTGKFNSIKIARRYLREKFGNKCAICGLTEWLGQPIALLCDHINGNSTDLSIENIRRICGNCDAQTPTFKNRNIGRGRDSIKNGAPLRAGPKSKSKL